MKYLDASSDDFEKSFQSLILSTLEPNKNVLETVSKIISDVRKRGDDALLEYQGNDFYEPFDLGIAKCQMMLAGLEKANKTYTLPRIATKYANITQNYFADLGQQVEIIKLYGSMELAPVLGLADQIVDLVDTGETLKANGLVPYEHITDISLSLIHI